MAVFAAVEGYHFQATKSVWQSLRLASSGRLRSDCIVGFDARFSVLRTGTRVKDRQLDDAEDLRNCLAVDAITACPVHDLNFIARTVPDTPASQVVGQEAIECLYNYRYVLRIDRSRAPPEKAPDIRTFIIDLAGIAGFDSTKRQPLPGTQKLCEAYLIFKPILVYLRGMNAEK